MSLFFPNEHQPLSAGTPLHTTSSSSSSKENAPPVPLLFQPIQIRGLLLPNRIVIPPMGMYSSPNGHMTNFHLVHYGSFALRGSGLTIVEATAVMANGRSSPIDNGLWDDTHVQSARKVVDFVHGLGQKIGIQLWHAGRRASMMPIYPGAKTRVAEVEEGGWPDDVYGASPVALEPGFVVPKEMTRDDIQGVVNAHANAAKRAVDAGFDVIEVHAAHGYLISSFLSPSSNHRTDEYGGSFENRILFLIEVVKAIRAAIPSSMPLFIRISATDWMEWKPEEPSWTIQDSIKLAEILSDLGVDLLDVSSGANNTAQRIPLDDAYYQVHLAEQIRKVLKEKGKGMLVGAVGKINNAKMARDILEEGKADVVLVGRQFLRDPNFLLRTGRELDVNVQWPRQYLRIAKE